ncbi:hypothetical protein RQP46_008893 [Phenoliferia psychrophenolica]
MSSLLRTRLSLPSSARSLHTTASLLKPSKPHPRSASAAPAPNADGEKPRRILSFATKSGQSHFKTFLPVTPSLRQLRQPISSHLHKGDPERQLTVAKRGTGGRNEHGRITTRARGGGHKRRVRLVDFARIETGEQEVVRIEYDPGRSAHIALLKHKTSEALSYILAPATLRAGDTVQSFRSGIPDSFTMGTSSAESDVDNLPAFGTTPLGDGSVDGLAALIAGSTDPAAPQSVLSPSAALPGQDAPSPSPSSLSTPSSPSSPSSTRTTSAQIDLGVLRSIAIRPGNCLPLRLIPVGTLIHAITLSPSGPAILARSAGSSARIISASSPTGKHAQVRLGSGEVRYVGLECCAAIGTVSNVDHQHRNLGKAGRMRWLGFRPLTRGVAMNATDHPHGGGRGKSKGNTDPVDPWGNSTKGARTRAPNSKNGNKFVVRERARGTEKHQKGR